MRQGDLPGTGVGSERGSLALTLEYLGPNKTGSVAFLRQVQSASRSTLCGRWRSGGAGHAIVAVLGCA